MNKTGNIFLSQNSHLYRVKFKIVLMPVWLLLNWAVVVCGWCFFWSPPQFVWSGPSSVSAGLVEKCYCLKSIFESTSITHARNTKHQQQHIITRIPSNERIRLLFWHAIQIRSHLHAYTANWNDCEAFKWKHLKQQHGVLTSQ